MQPEVVGCADDCMIQSNTAFLTSRSAEGFFVVPNKGKYVYY